MRRATEIKIWITTGQGVCPQIKFTVLEALHEVTSIAKKEFPRLWHQDLECDAIQPYKKVDGTLLNGCCGSKPEHRREEYPLTTMTASI